MEETIPLHCSALDVQQAQLVGIEYLRHSVEPAPQGLWRVTSTATISAALSSQKSFRAYHGLNADNDSLASPFAATLISVPVDWNNAFQLMLMFVKHRVETML